MYDEAADLALIRAPRSLKDRMLAWLNNQLPGSFFDRFISHQERARRTAIRRILTAKTLAVLMRRVHPPLPADQAFVNSPRIGKSLSIAQPQSYVKF